jgi:hypothetical protein
VDPAQEHAEQVAGVVEALKNEPKAVHSGGVLPAG